MFPLIKYLELVADREQSRTAWRIFMVCIRPDEQKLAVNRMRNLGGSATSKLGREQFGWFAADW